MNWEIASPQRFAAGGAMLEGQCHGPSPAQARTIVLLHEGLGSMGLWRDFPHRLAAATGMGVFAYSRRGYGHSDTVALPRPLDYMVREAVEVLPDVFSAIGFRQGILLGHSDGASVAALYPAHVADHRVRGLVLMAPHFFTEPQGLAAIAAARDAYESGELRARLARHHGDVEAAFRGWSDAWLDPGFAAWNIEDALDYIRVPVLAIQGEADPYGTAAQIEALRTRLYCPLEAVMLAGGGHAPHVSHPAETLAAVTDFLARLWRMEDGAAA